MMYVDFGHLTFGVTHALYILYILKAGGLALFINSAHPVLTLILFMVFVLWWDCAVNGLFCPSFIFVCSCCSRLKGAFWCFWLSFGHVAFYRKDARSIFYFFFSSSFFSQSFRFSLVFPSVFWFRFRSDLLEGVWRFFPCFAQTNRSRSGMLIHVLVYFLFG